MSYVYTAAVTAQISRLLGGDRF